VNEAPASLAVAAHSDQSAWVGGEARGAESGQEPGGGTDDYRPAQPAGPGDRRDDGGPTFGMGADDGGGGPGEYPGRPAGQRKQDGFGYKVTGGQGRPEPAATHWPESAAAMSSRMRAGGRCCS
jgi:hypothetical protein